MSEQKRLLGDPSLDQEMEDLVARGNQAPSIAYVGPAVDNGRMDAVLLSEGIRGYARFVNRVAELYLKNPTKVSGSRSKGSLELARSKS